ncbi:MAG: DUF3566 domain-containing protein, partial [Sciscionella sp.]
MTQAHGGPTFGQAATAAGEFGATTVSGRPKPSEPGAPTASVPRVGGPMTDAAIPISPQFPPQAPPGAPQAPPGARQATVPPAASKSSARSRARGPRRARLQLRHINPWTVLKFSCVLSIALFFVWLIVIGVLFGVLDAAGVIGKINDTVTTINGQGSKDPVTAGIVFG